VSGGAGAAQSYVMFPYDFTEYLAPVNTHTHTAGFLIEYYKLNFRVLNFKPVISCRRKGALAC
jgi:hypothetical protein